MKVSDVYFTGIVIGAERMVALVGGHVEKVFRRRHLVITWMPLMLAMLVLVDFLTVMGVGRSWRSKIKCSSIRAATKRSYVECVLVGTIMAGVTGKRGSFGLRTGINVQ